MNTISDITVLQKQPSNDVKNVTIAVLKDEAEQLVKNMSLVERKLSQMCVSEAYVNLDFECLENEHNKLSLRLDDVEAKILNYVPRNNNECVDLLLALLSVHERWAEVAPDSDVLIKMKTLISNMK